jgi:hypothetical protein
MMSELRRALLGAILGVLLLVTVPAVVAAPETVPIGPGTTHTRIYRPEGPWAINVVEADLSQEFVKLKSLLGLAPLEDGGLMMGRRTVAEMMAVEEPGAAGDAAATSAGVRPVAAVNGDFFALAGEYYATTPLGLLVERGEMITSPDPARSVLYVLADGTPHIGRFRPNLWLHGPDGLLYQMVGMNRSPGYADLVLFTPRFGGRTWAAEDTTQFALVGLSGPLKPNAEVRAKVASSAVTGSQRIPPDGTVLAARGVAAYALRRLKVGDEVRLSLKIEPEVGEIVEAVGGGPRLVREGVVSVEHLQERFADQFATRRHPRTGVGIRDKTLVMVTVDGRQPGYSEGMTLPELAQLFLELGCTEAMNLDGGGSTTMVVRSTVVNSPSGGVPRAVVNALALFSAAPAGPPEHLAIEPTELSVLSGEWVALQARGLDQYYGPVPLGRDDVTWTCAGALGQVDEAGVFTAAQVSLPTIGLVMARCGSLTAASVVRVVPWPARVAVAPGEASLEAGAAQQFFAQAYTGEGMPLRLPPGAVVWGCEPSEAGGAIDQSGLLRAPTSACRLTVTARVGDVRGQAAVAVVGGSEAAPEVIERAPAAPKPAPGATQPAPGVSEISPRVIEDFEAQGAWSYRAIPAGAPGAVERREDPVQAGNHCLCLKYDLSRRTGTQTAHVELNLALPEARSLSLRVLGDGQGEWLRARLRDGAGRASLVDLANRVDWSGEWRVLTVPLPEGMVGPVTLESVYVAEFRAGRQPAGEILVDDIGTPAGRDAREGVPPAGGAGHQ